MKPLDLIRGILTSCAHAARGIGFAARSQRNFRIHLLAAGAVLAGALALGLSRVELVLLILTAGLVILGELINTGLEFLLNLLEARNHPTVRMVKDIAAGAVLTAVIGSVAVAFLLFGPKLLEVFRRWW